VFLVVATLLGRWPRSPLRTRVAHARSGALDSLLAVFVTVAAWLFAMSWREQWRGAYDLKRWQFNLLQCALAAFTLFAVTSLVFSGVRYGLLASPDMGVTGPGSSGNTFSWFVDRAASRLPHPVVYSLPLWSTARSCSPGRCGSRSRSRAGCALPGEPGAPEALRGAVLPPTLGVPARLPVEYSQCIRATF